MNSVFSRNFDYQPDDRSESDDSGIQETPDTVSLADAELMAQRARSEGFEQGQVVGATKALNDERASREARCDATLQILAEKLNEIALRDQKMRTEITLEMTELIAGIGERILPDLFESLIGDALIARAHSAIRMMAGTGSVAIRLPSDLFDTVFPTLDRLIKNVDTGMTQIEIVADDRIDDETIRIDWKNGFLKFDPACASLEVLEVLKEAKIELRSQLEKM